MNNKGQCEYKLADKVNDLRKTQTYRNLYDLEHMLPFSGKNRFFTNDMTGDLMLIVQSIRNRMLIATEQGDEQELGVLRKITGFMQYREPYGSPNDRKRKEREV